MAAWSHKTLKINHFFAFSGKTTPFKILLRRDSSRYRSTCCVQISWNLADGKSVKSCVVYVTKKNKISPGSPALATARIAPKICHGQPQTMCSRFHPNRFTFGGVIPERVNAVKTGRKVFPIFGWNLASSWIINWRCNVYYTLQRQFIIQLEARFVVGLHDLHHVLIEVTPKFKSV